MQDYMQTMQEAMKMMHASKGMMAGMKQDGKRIDMMQIMMDPMDIGKCRATPATAAHC